MSTTSKRTIIATSVVAALVLVLLLQAFAAACPVCGGRVVKTATVNDDTNAPSKNSCVWNRSICGNVLYGPDAVLCTRCWHAHSKLLIKWERSSELPASFHRPLGSAIRGVPIPPADAVRSGVVFTQTYAKKTFAESVSFWCVDDEHLLASLRGYCTTNHLTFSFETNRIAGQVFIKVE